MRIASILKFKSSMRESVFPIEKKPFGLKWRSKETPRTPNTFENSWFFVSDLLRQTPMTSNSVSTRV